MEPSKRGKCVPLLSVFFCSFICFTYSIYTFYTLFTYLVLFCSDGKGTVLFLIRWMGLLTLIVVFPLERFETSSENSLFYVVLSKFCKY